MKAPERIYLVDPDLEEEDAGPGMGCPTMEGVYWCEDRIHNSDVEYVRADLAHTKEAAPSDEQILDLAEKHLTPDFGDVLEFARAVLALAATQAPEETKDRRRSNEDREAI